MSLAIIEAINNNFLQPSRELLNSATLEREEPNVSLLVLAIWLSGGVCWQQNCNFPGDFPSAVCATLY